MKLRTGKNQFAATFASAATISGVKFLSRFESILSGFKTEAVLALGIAGLVGLSAQATVVVDRDMTITTAPGGVEFAGDYTLTVEFEDEVGVGKVVNDGHRAKLRLNKGSARVTAVEGKNGSYTCVEFNGGAFADGGGWGSAWCKPDETSTIEISSVNGNPIVIAHPNSQERWRRDGVWYAEQNSAELNGGRKPLL